MKTVGNVLWIIFGGLLLALLWGIAGIVCCVTLVGIPVGVQCFKFARLMLAPFGKDVEFGNGFGSLILNILWICVFGVELSVTAAVIGLLWCVTVVGIPVGLQSFKFAKLAFLPFGAKIVKK